jgi:AmpD protein
VPGLKQISLSIQADTGLCQGAIYVASPNCDAREHHEAPEAIILHSISLPPGEYGEDYVSQFFCNRLDPQAHDYFADIAHLRVSSHFFIRRDGKLVQYVPTGLRAWHAGDSVCLGKSKVNDFSIGIELEGLDVGDDGFTEPQYDTLNELLLALHAAYPNMDRKAIFSHSDIAPGRKCDPGPFFDWSRIFSEFS